MDGNGPLSQEAIDALLAAALEGGAPPPADPPSRPAFPTARGGNPFRARLEEAVADLEVEVVAVLGEVELPVRDVLALRPGSVLELDARIDAPVEIRLRGRTVARGQVVLEEGYYALRITENRIRPVAR